MEISSKLEVIGRCGGDEKTNDILDYTTSSELTNILIHAKYSCSHQLLSIFHFDMICLK